MRIFMVILILSCSPEVLWVIVDYDAILHNGFPGADVFTKLVEVVSLLLNWVGGVQKYSSTFQSSGCPRQCGYLFGSMLLAQSHTNILGIRCVPDTTQSKSTCTSHSPTPIRLPLW